MKQFQQMKKAKSSQQGFTLIELVIVIVIAGILGSALVATYVDLSADAEDANIEQSVAAINSAIAIEVAQSDGDLTAVTAADVEALTGNLQTEGVLSLNGDVGFAGDDITVGNTTVSLVTSPCGGDNTTICSVATSS